MILPQQVAWQESRARAFERPRPPEILVIIPAFNEEASIEGVVSKLLGQKKIDLHVLVVNDGSKDRTEAIVREFMKASDRLFLLNLPNNMGIGGAVQAGFKYALNQRYAIVVQVDGDGQHRVDQLHKVILPIQENRADIVVGSRFLEKNSYNSSIFRAAGIKFFTTLISILTGSPVTDPTSGFRAYNEPTIEYLAENYADDYPEPESLIILHRRRFRSMEVPVIMNDRAGGKSSISPLRAGYYMVKVTIAIIVDHFRKRV